MFFDRICSSLTLHMIIWCIRSWQTQGIGDKVENSLGVDSQGFKQVNSKSKRKAREKNAVGSKYATRLMPGNANNSS
ncbi:unnamed protein product [Lathyrus sativus]|nr:unnamed protein product [Lathyrus sativus]